MTFLEGYDTTWSNTAHVAPVSQQQFSSEKISQQQLPLAPNQPAPNVQRSAISGVECY